MATTTFTPSMLRGAGTRGIPEIPAGSSYSYLLDDYGTMGYEDQYYQEKTFFNDLGYSVFEFPTGGGMVIKR